MGFGRKQTECAAMIAPTRLQPLLIAIAACVCLAAFAAYDLVRERDLAIANAKSGTANLARLLEEQVRQGLHRVEATLAAGAARVARLPATPETLQSLQALLPADGLVRALELRDDNASGAGSVATTPPTGAGLVLGRLEKDGTGRWLLPAIRRLGAADGGPGGALVAQVDPAVFQRVFAELDTGVNGFVTLFGADGWMLATSPANEALLSRNWRDTPMFTQHLPRNSVGTVQQVVVRDGTERVYSYRALADFPVVVSVGVSLADVLAAWRVRLFWNAGLLAVMCTALLGAALALARHYERREAAERALAEAAGQTRAIVDHVADTIVTFNTSGKIESINLAGESTFGSRAANIVGHSVQTLVPGLALAEQDGQRTHAEGCRGDGSRFPIELALTQAPRAGQPLRIALIRDVTEARKAQAVIAEARERAERSERFLRQVTDNVPLRIAYVDRELRYRFVNQAHCERFGLPREAVIGRTRQELTRGDTAPAVMAELQRVLQGEERRFEFSETVAGRSFVIESHAVPDIADDGSVHGFYAASTDVTERHQQQRRIEAALADRETLLREVYHRVKNNLQVVQSLLSLQQRALPEGEARAALQDSVQRVRAMALVHEKLYQTGNLSAVELPEYTADLVQQIGESAGAQARGIALQVDVCRVQAALDVALPFGLLVAELVTNSLKHGFPAGRAGAVHVHLARADTFLRLQVSDSGVSLPPTFDLAQTRSMGLQLAASLAGQLGGTLKAHSEGGAVFSADLPRLG
jgi:PAS domain S-box-containing protein